jgi:hypothetical protein
MTTNTAERRDQITVPIDPELRREIARAAAAEHRTMAGQIRHWIATATRIKPMALGTARQAFLSAVAPHDEVDDRAPPNYAAGLQVVLDAVALLKDPALLQLNAKKALEAQQVIAKAYSDRVALDTHRRDVEAEIDAARKAHAVALNKERDAHDKFVADSRKEIEADKKAIADLKAQAAKDAAKAKADKDEAARRLRAMAGAP